jgi:hypothetical protein
MRPSKWLVFIRPSLAGFDRPLTAVQFERIRIFLANLANPLGTRQPSNPHLSRFRSNQHARINPERKGSRINE